jgi:hypothetical protein
MTRICRKNSEDQVKNQNRLNQCNQEFSPGSGI